MTGCIGFMIGAGNFNGPTNFGGNIEASSLSPATATASATIESTGAWTATASPLQNIDTITGDRWFGPGNAVGANYWVRATLTAGTAPTGGSGTGTWLQLSSARSWSKTQSTIGSTSSTLLIEVATDAGGVNVVCSGSIVIKATEDA
jgi:hypothetical protein